MFNLYYGNDAEALLRRLGEQIAVPHGGNPLEPEIVLVPQFGLRRWIEIRLAELTGIVANVDFYAPSEYAWRLLRAARPPLPARSAWDRDTLRWRIFAQLATLAAEPRFAFWTRSPGDFTQDLRLRFADELAQLFERYLAYRSDLLARWERGADADDWQAELWRRLTRATAEPHRARLLGDYIDTHATRAPPGLPPRLFAFACTNISPDLLHFYGVVSRHCDLQFHMPNPCRQYWGEVRSERERLRTLGGDAFADADNPLLAAYGRAGRDFVAQLFSYEQVQPQDEQDLSTPRDEASLLHHLQADVLDLLPPRVRADRPAPHDRSLQLHACHSRLREVQVLHDELLDLFQKDPQLTPRDVAVMTPDIAAYAPCIDAVFGGLASSDPRYLPYVLSDNAPRDRDPLVALVLKLAALPLSRFGLSDVIEILSLPAVQRRFDLDDAAVAQAESWLRDAGVRWGIDAEQHVQFGAGEYREYSWDFGLERLLLGYAAGDEQHLVSGIAPACAVEGAGTQTLGAVLRVLQILRTLRERQSRPQTPAHWQEIYNAAFDALFADSGERDERRAFELVRAALADIAEQATSAGLTETLDWRCVRDCLESRLAEPERSYRFFSGGINVCGMIPLRAVPFRVICLIGMNAENFPRRDRATALARPAAAATRAERTEREDDRYLFLQLLTSARDVFYLSWIGEEQRDGSARAPSAVVAELIEVLARQYFVDAQSVRDRVVVRHPLQPFSPRNFPATHTPLFSYRGEWRATSGTDVFTPRPFADGQRLAAASGKPVAITPCVFEAQDLRAFLRAPARIYLRESLGVFLDRDDEPVVDEDPLELDGLGCYALRDYLARTAPADAIGDIGDLRARALLPAGPLAIPVLRQERGAAAALAEAERRGHVVAEPRRRFEIAFVDAARLVGVLPAHAGGRAMQWRAGDLNGKRLLGAWIDFLVLAAEFDDAALTLLGYSKGIKRAHFFGVERESARSILHDLLQRRRSGVHAPLLFFPDASLAYARAWCESHARDEAAHAAALLAARRVFCGDNAQREETSRGAEVDREASFALVTRDLDLFDPESAAARDFAAIARDIYAPLLAAVDAT